MLTFAQILKNVVKHQATFMEVYLKIRLFCLTFSLVQSTFKRLMRDRPLLVETTWRLHRAGKHTIEQYDSNGQIVFPVFFSLLIFSKTHSFILPPSPPPHPSPITYQCQTQF